MCLFEMYFNNLDIILDLLQVKYLQLLNVVRYLGLYNILNIVFGIVYLQSIF